MLTLSEGQYFDNVRVHHTFKVFIVHVVQYESQISGMFIMKDKVVNRDK